MLPYPKDSHLLVVMILLKRQQLHLVDSKKYFKSFLNTYSNYLSTSSNDRNQLVINSTDQKNPKDQSIQLLDLETLKFFENCKINGKDHVPCSFKNEFELIGMISDLLDIQFKIYYVFKRKLTSQKIGSKSKNKVFLFMNSENEFTMLQKITQYTSALVTQNINAQIKVFIQNIKQSNSANAISSSVLNKDHKSKVAKNQNCLKADQLGNQPVKIHEQKTLDYSKNSTTDILNQQSSSKPSFGQERSHTPIKQTIGVSGQTGKVFSEVLISQN